MLSEELEKTITFLVDKAESRKILTSVESSEAPIHELDVQSESIESSSMIGKTNAPVQCDVCGKILSNASNLRIHKLLHLGELQKQLL